MYDLKSAYPDALWHHGSEDPYYNGFQQHPFDLHWSSLIPLYPHSTLLEGSATHLSW